MIIPSWNPCKVLVCKKQVVIGTVLADSCSVVYETD
jgi:hypothetical protein